MVAKFSRVVAEWKQNESRKEAAWKQNGSRMLAEWKQNGSRMAELNQNASRIEAE